MMLESFDLRVQDRTVRTEMRIIFDAVIALESCDGILAIGAKQHILRTVSCDADHIIRISLV